MAGPGRTRNAWTELVVYSAPSCTSELLNKSVCEREFSEEESALHVKEAFVVQSVRSSCPANLGQKHGLRVALVSFGQDVLGRFPSCHRVHGASLMIVVRKRAPKPVRRS